jgi:UDP-galactopyranose mutase
MKILCVGAGWAGAVAARELAEAGHEVLVIDKRNHIGGNAYDFVNEHGIRIHRYGPHLWHTSNDKVQEWVSRFTEWVPYRHWVHALLPDGQSVPLPINRLTIETVFAKELNDMYGQVGEQDIGEFMALKQYLDQGVGDVSPKNSREHVEASVGKELCELFFAPYTKKMWGMDLSDLPASVAKRIPTKLNYDPYYFPNDKHQYLPKNGYTAIFLRILSHPNIKVVLSCGREELPQYADPYSRRHFRLISGWEDVEFDAVFTSEPIDTYYNCDWGELPWRSVKFHTYSIPLPKTQTAPVVNFTHDGPYTRSTEWKQLPGHAGDPCWTTITVEEPCDYSENNMERYYPVKTSHEVDPNRELYERYHARAKGDGIHFIGRCGTYTYTDMAPCISSTLAQVRRFLAGDTIPVA